MSRYMETANELRKNVEAFMKVFVEDAEPLTVEVNGQQIRMEPQDHTNAAAVQLGYIINLAVRCSPRPVQGTVRKNIVAEAMKSYCKVTMTKEYDEIRETEYNKIHITARG
jgi:hypothetical protein